MNEFFTWAVLGTYAGAALATALFTQFLKETALFKGVPTRAVSYVIAYAVLMLAHAFTGSVSWGSAALSLVNAVVVALAANGGYDAAGRAAGTNKTE